MIIYVNGKFLTQRLTGVQRYAFEITKALISLGANIKILVPSYLDISTVSLPKEHILSVGSFKNTMLWEQLSLAKFLRNKNDYVLLSLCNVGTLFNRNQIVCIHDMTYNVNPQWFSKSFRRYYRFMIPRLAKLAKKVITVSEFSKKELSEQLGLQLKDITVVYNAPSDKFKRAIDDINYEKDGYFLFVGSLDPRKNLKLLVELFSTAEFNGEKLLVVGARSKSFEEVRLDIPNNIQLLQHCDDDQLADLYANARALISPSFYEGFGIPVVEAMASGCPLIASNIDAFKEIIRKEATYFSPHSLQELIIAMKEFNNKSSEEINMAIDSNYERSKMFTWHNSARVLMNLIDTL